MEQDVKWLLRDKYNGRETLEFHADVKRLQAGEPLPYIIGWVPFGHAKIWLDSRPLIPRAETEYWTQRAIEDARNTFTGSLRVLDLCAGSGCIGISFLKAFPGAHVDFVEINEIHHKTIWKNVKENEISIERVQILGGNLFEKVVDQYDIIVTNPPYIDPLLKSRIDTSVLLFEPHEALFGGINGTELLQEIVKQAPQFLRHPGLLYIEHEPEHDQFVRESLPGSVSYKDQFGLMRYTVYKS